MATIEQLKEQIDLHDLAQKLELRRGTTGNYHSPHREDKKPSLSIFANATRWKDHTSGEGGTCIDLVMHVEGCEAGEAIKRLHELYGLPMDRPNSNDPPAEKSRAEYIADKCFDNTAPVMEYLTKRGILESVVARAIKKRTVGFNDWTSPTKAPREFGYGGPAAAFIVRSLNPGHVAAVDLRYFDPELNGGVKTQTQGEKSGAPWIMDAGRLKAAQTVYLVESAINALSIESCEKPYTTAVAIRGVGNADNIDFRFLQGKRVIICMDADAPNEEGFAPGASAAWLLHERLTALNIAAHIVDQETWYELECNDVNDILQQKNGVMELSIRLKQLEQWLVPGLWGDSNKQPMKGRVWLPFHDFSQYWRYRCQEDFTYCIKEKKADQDGNEKITTEDVCGFRIASISRVTIASAGATMTGEEDAAPQVMFAVTTQTALHGNKLQRRVVEDEKLHRVEEWQKFGKVYARGPFLRMVNILERTVHIGERNAINFVGIGWREGKPIVNEGPDCFFTDPRKQCPYWNLMFPSGPRDHGRRVLHAYHETMGDNAATLLLVWALGGHLKAWLGFWPHMVLQADKGAGKSTLIKKLERSIAFTMFSGQSLQTEFRLLTSVSHTSHPVGWEEISARRQDVIDKAVSLLQESYNFTLTYRGSEMTQYLVSAPVLLAGEDVPVDSLLGKVIRTDINAKKGPMIPVDLPRFPVLEWLRFLTDLSRDRVAALYKQAQEYAVANCMASRDDDGAKRMVDNYAALLTAWRLLEEFCNEPKDRLGFVRDAIAMMNSHISETHARRQPWVWILETVFGEISNGNYRYPYKFVMSRHLTEDVPCLVIRHGHIMQHLSSNMNLRDKYNALPVKSDRVLKRQLVAAGVVLSERVDTNINSKREHHMLALSLPKLREYGLHVSEPESPEHEMFTSDTGTALL